jgi:hypothetical protein
MLMNAFTLATVTFIGAVILYSKLPRKVRRFIARFHLIFDLATLIGIYILFGQTATALIAGAIVGILTSIGLHVAKNEDEFLYIYDLKDFIKEQLAAAKEALNAYSSKYREQKELKKASNTDEETKADNVIEAEFGEATT